MHQRCIVSCTHPHSHMHTQSLIHACVHPQRRLLLPRRLPRHRLSRLLRHHRLSPRRRAVVSLDASRPLEAHSGVRHRQRLHHPLRLLRRRRPPRRLHQRLPPRPPRHRHQRSLLRVRLRRPPRRLRRRPPRRLRRRRRSNPRLLPAEASLGISLSLSFSLSLSIYIYIYTHVYIIYKYTYCRYHRHIITLHT